VKASADTAILILLAYRSFKFWFNFREQAEGFHDRRRSRQGACRNQDAVSEAPRSSPPYNTKRQFTLEDAARCYIEEVMTAAVAPLTKEFSNGLENTDDH
jgi:hypothetical protein